MNTYVYVDAFNLYYGALKGTSNKWLDINKLCRKLLPHDRIIKIRYFTALVKSLPGDNDQPIRQRLYLDALRTLPNLVIHYGSFRTNPRMKPKSDGTGFVEVLITEEKGSDVNLAAYLVHDGHLNRYDTAVVISHDADLLEAVNIVKTELKKVVGVLNPQRHPNEQLIGATSFYKPIRKNVLESCQFPNPVLR